MRPVPTGVVTFGITDAQRKYTLDRQLSYNRSCLRNYLSSIAEYREKIESTYYDDKAYYREQILRFKRYIVQVGKSTRTAKITYQKSKMIKASKLNFSEIREALLSNVNVVPNSIRFLDRPGGGISWVFRGLIMTIGENLMGRSMCNGKHNLKVKVPDTRLTVFRDNSGNLDVCFKRAHWSRYRNVPQPHVMYRGNPCYGDFKNSITAAYNEGCIADFIVLNQMYLEAIDPHDSAGENWFKWVTPNIAVKFYNSSCNYVEYDRYLDDEGNGYIIFYRQYGQRPSKFPTKTFESMVERGQRMKIIRKGRKLTE